MRLGGSFAFSHTRARTHTHCDAHTVPKLSGVRSEGQAEAQVHSEVMRQWDQPLRGLLRPISKRRAAADSFILFSPAQVSTVILALKHKLLLYVSDEPGNVSNARATGVAGNIFEIKTVCWYY